MNDVFAMSSHEVNGVIAFCHFVMVPVLPVRVKVPLFVP